MKHEFTTKADHRVIVPVAAGYFDSGCSEAERLREALIVLDQVKRCVDGGHAAFVADYVMCKFCGREPAALDSGEPYCCADAGRAWLAKSAAARKCEPDMGDPR